MNLFNNIRIKNKLILIIVIVGVLSSLTGIVINYFYELKQARDRLISDTRLHAKLIGEYCSLPLEFNYSENAHDVLNKLETMPNISDGVLFNKNDFVFSEYHRSAKDSSSFLYQTAIVDYEFHGNYLLVKQEIFSKTGSEGYIILRAKVDWQFIILKQLILNVGLMLIMVFIVVMLAFYFQRSISEPILNLTGQMEQISGSNNYSITAAYDRKDEIGELYNGFNLMIQKIKTRETEKEATLQELKLSEVRYQNLYEKAPVMYLSVDVETLKIILCNSTLCQLTGFSKQELYGKPIFDFYHPDSLDAVKETFEQFLNEGIVQNEQHKIIKKDGSTMDISLSATAAKDENGKILFSQSVWMDVTERERARASEKEAMEETKRLFEQAEKSRRVLLSVVEDQKKAKEEIQTLNNNLELRVAQRTEQLESANKELEAFSYSISHDLRAPLRHINGFINLFLENSTTKHTDEELGYLNVVSNSAKDMGELIDALLSFARLSRMEMNYSIIHSEKTIDELLPFFAEELKSRNIELKINKLLPVMGDAKLIKQVWINLLSNAIKYTGNKEHAKIEIGCEEASNETVFYMKDNGTGFDMKYASKLFGVFQRLHKVREFEGIGIGLANVNRIITKHNGRCWATAELEKGATFFFSLPNNLSATSPA